MRFRTSLLLFALATGLPLVLFAILATLFEVRQQTANLEAVAKTRNRALMSAVDAEIGGAIRTLQAVANAESLATDDLKTFDAFARQVLSTHPSWNNVLLHDPAGRQLINARLPAGTALSPTPIDPNSIDAVVRLLQPAVGNVIFLPLLQNLPSIPVRVPVLRNSKAVYVLTAVLDPDTFQKLLAGQNLPDRFVSGLVDRQGRFIARMPPMPVGSMASQPYRDNIRGAAEGWFRSTTVEGIENYSAFLKSDLTGWSIGYALPAEFVSAGAMQAARATGVGILLSLLAAAVIGYWLSRRISKPISELTKAAALLGSGRAPIEVHSTINEVAALSSALGSSGRAIAQRDQELRRTLDNQTQFIALLSHELRNPLAPLTIGIGMLKMKLEPERMTEMLAIMQRQVEHITRLIDDLLDVGRIGRGMLELRRQTVSINDIVSRTVETLIPAAAARQQQIIVNYAPERLFVDGDAVRLNQVVSNLAHNALKYSSEHARIEISTLAEGQTALITVKDNGIGFAPHKSDRMFDLFVQLDPEHRQVAGGLGLGLPLAKSLVQMHGGRLEAESGGPGKGATFTVRLPRVVPPTETTHVVTTAALPQPPRFRRVLVVDDNRDVAASLSQVLRFAGFDVRESHDGSAALEIGKSFKPEVAFIDLNMPRMTGTELAAQLRAQTWASGLRMIALTGMARTGDSAVSAAGFHGYLTKPVTSEDILRLASGHEEKPS